MPFTEDPTSVEIPNADVAIAIVLCPESEFADASAGNVSVALFNDESLMVPPESKSDPVPTYSISAVLYPPTTVNLNVKNLVPEPEI